MVLAETKEHIMDMIIEEAMTNKTVPIPIALGVAKIESNFNDSEIGTSGEIGVMQIMPKTAMEEFNAPRQILFDPRTNIKLGIAYLERLYNLYNHNWTLALSHYNGGSLKIVDGNWVQHSYNVAYVNNVLNASRQYGTVNNIYATNKIAAIQPKQHKTYTTYNVPAGQVIQPAYVVKNGNTTTVYNTVVYAYQVLR